MESSNLTKLLDWKVFEESLRYEKDHYRRYDAADYLYREILEAVGRKPLGELLKREKFLRLIYATLDAFNMNQRAARLIGFSEFKENIESQKKGIEDLSRYKLVSISDSEVNDVLNAIKATFLKLNIMNGKSQIVGISKTLHFLLPNLVMPIDRRYTLNFFYGNNQYNQEREREFNTLREVFGNYHKIICELKLKESKFNLPIPKGIDNAIIGFMNKNVYKKK